MLKNKRLPAPPHCRGIACSRTGFTSTGVVIILGAASLLTAIALPTIQDHRRQTSVETTQKRMEKVIESLQEYSRVHCGRFPTSSQGLRIPSANDRSRDISDREPILSEIPRDPWGNTFLYISPGVMNPDTFDICSSGPDQVLGTADDITNWTTH